MRKPLQTIIKSVYRIGRQKVIKSVFCRGAVGAEIGGGSILYAVGRCGIWGAVVWCIGGGGMVYRVGRCGIWGAVVWCIGWGGVVYGAGRCSAWGAVVYWG